MVVTAEVTLAEVHKYIPEFARRYGLDVDDLHEASSGLPQVPAGLPRASAGLPRASAGLPRALAELARVLAELARVFAHLPTSARQGSHKCRTPRGTFKIGEYARD